MNIGGREIFAKWVPKFDNIAPSFITDANGYDLVSHPTYVDDSEYFSASFVPVDASITASDYARTRMVTIWNDRPQAGSVHGDGSINLLV